MYFRMIIKCIGQIARLIHNVLGHYIGEKKKKHNNYKLLYITLI